MDPTVARVVVLALVCARLARLRVRSGDAAAGGRGAGRESAVEGRGVADGWAETGTRRHAWPAEALAAPGLAHLGGPGTDLDALVLLVVRAVVLRDRLCEGHRVRRVGRCPVYVGACGCMVGSDAILRAGGRPGPGRREETRGRWSRSRSEGRRRGRGPVDRPGQLGATGANVEDEAAARSETDPGTTRSGRLAGTVSRSPSWDRAGGDPVAGRRRVLPWWAAGGIRPGVYSCSAFAPGRSTARQGPYPTTGLETIQSERTV